MEFGPETVHVALIAWQRTDVDGAELRPTASTNRHNHSIEHEIRIDPKNRVEGEFGLTLTPADEALHCDI
jgi:hypothetical protein